MTCKHPCLALDGGRREVRTGLRLYVPHNSLVFTPSFKADTALVSQIVEAPISPLTLECLKTSLVMAF